MPLFNCMFKYNVEMAAVYCMIIYNVARDPVNCMIRYNVAMAPAYSIWYNVAMIIYSILIYIKKINS